MRRQALCGIAILFALLSSGCSGSSPATKAAAGSTGSSTSVAPLATSGSASSAGSTRTSPSASTSKVPLDLRTKVGSATAPSVVRGFQYTVASRSAVNAAAQVGQQYSQVSTGRAVRGITQGGRRVGDVVSFGLKANFAKNVTFRGQFLNALVVGLAGSRSVVSQEGVGETGVTVATGASRATVGWLDGNTIYVVVVPPKSLPVARNFISAYPRTP